MLPIVGKNGGISWQKAVIENKNGVGHEASGFSSFSMNGVIDDLTTSYPLLCQLQCHQDLVVTNMADKNMSQQVFNLIDDKFIKFVETTTH